MESERYSLGLPELGDDTFQPGSNIIIFGPPECGKDVILRRIILHGLRNGERAIFVTASISSIHESKFYEREKFRDEITFIDPLSSGIFEISGIPENVELVPSLSDITVLNVKIVQAIEKYLRDGKKRKIRIGINSISTLLMYNSPQVVYRFMHSLTERVRSARALGIYILEQGMHSVEIENMFKQLCNGIIELRKGQSSPLMRLIRYPFRTSEEVEVKFEEEGIVE
ncbi:MAG: hypothetical protein PWR13_469 [Archaeoglobi archaeon]|nr:hypothetical protein [Archaeoglobi archaeon]MDK2781441.1 hypothetical protein [Archaeoglobi archaeon]